MNLLTGGRLAKAYSSPLPCCGERLGIFGGRVLSSVFELWGVNLGKGATKLMNLCWVVVEPFTSSMDCFT